MAEVPSFKAVMERSAPTDSEMRQFMADNQFQRAQEWARKYLGNPMDLFGNCS